MSKQIYVNKKHGVKLIVNDSYLQYANISLSSPRNGNYNGIINSDKIKDIVKKLDLVKVK
jgi:CTP:phosphocholine cytidylyltransferase-like protein